MSVYRQLVETSLGRKLKLFEEVHHLNSDHNDDRLSNLCVVSIEQHKKITTSLSEEQCRILSGERGVTAKGNLLFQLKTNTAFHDLLVEIYVKHNPCVSDIKNF